MKIHESQKVLIEQQGKVNKNKSVDNSSFQQIMDQMAANTNTNNALPANINTVQIINGPAEAFPINGAMASKEKDFLLDSLKNTLDLIDFYAGKLADDKFPAENLSALVDQLDEKLESIKGMSVMEDVPEKLKPVISDLAVTIGTEIERFRRGDYI